MQGEIPNQNLKGDQLALMSELAHGHVNRQFALVKVRGFPG